jgi:hypothetical protein
MLGIDESLPHTIPASRVPSLCHTVKAAAITLDQGRKPMDAADIVRQLGLQPHPEGGYFRETYRAVEAIPASGLDRRYGGGRATSTAIYYLLEAGQRSALHRLISDEVFHFYTGDPLRIVAIAPDGSLTETLLGADLATGAIPQHVVPTGSWFGAIPAGGSVWSAVPSLPASTSRISSWARRRRSWPRFHATRPGSAA